jgi:hypothetical protein
MNFEEILRSFHVSSVVPWKKEKFDFNCYTIKQVIKKVNN